MAKAVKGKRDQGFFKFIKWFWILFATGILSIALLFLLASWGVFGELPTFETLENPQTNLASEIISSDGMTLGKFYLDDNRTDVSYEDLPENLVNTLMASEDIRFQEHSGIEWYGKKRRCKYDLTAIGKAALCWSSIEKQIRDHKTKGNGVGYRHPFGTQLYKRRNHQDVFEYI